MPLLRVFSDPVRRREWLIAATVLFGAWLLFQIQPMAGKRILPWFGGGPAVWTTAMLFFQALLLGGYLYAHLSTRLLPPRAQALLHAALLLFAVVMLAIYGVSLGNEWKPADSDHPQLRILAILAVSVGLPYLMLSATAPLVQSWLGRTSAGRSPYRLYALSNFGSLAALVSYPVIVEPLMGLHMQGILWSGLFLAFAVLCAASGWSASGAVPDEQMREAPPRAKPLSPGMRRKDSSRREKFGDDQRWNSDDARSLLLGGAAGVCVVDVARRDQLLVPRRRAGSAAVDRAARRLPHHVHSDIRERSLVSPLAVAGGDGCPLVCGLQLLDAKRG